MINLIIWFAACPNPNHTPENHDGNIGIHFTTVLTNDYVGVTGGLPKPPFPPPPPPPTGN